MELVPPRHSLEGRQFGAELRALALPLSKGRDQGG